MVISPKDFSYFIILFYFAHDSFKYVHMYDLSGSTFCCFMLPYIGILLLSSLTLQGQASHTTVQAIKPMQMF